MLRDSPASAWGRGCEAGRAALAFPVGTSSAFPVLQSASLLAGPTAACLIAVPPLALLMGAWRRMSRWDEGEGRLESGCSPPTLLPSFLPDEESLSAVVLLTVNPPAERAGQAGKSQAGAGEHVDILGNPRFPVHKKPQGRGSASSPGWRTFPGDLVELLGPQPPQDPFLEEPGEEESSQRKLPHRWPPSRENAAASLESSGAWGLGAFPCYFFGEAT